MGSDSTLRILDVGCGIGGSSRIMAKRYGEAVQVGRLPRYCVSITVESV